MSSKAFLNKKNRKEGLLAEKWQDSERASRHLPFGPAVGTLHKRVFVLSLAFLPSFIILFISLFILPLLNLTVCCSMAVIVVK